MPSLVLNGKNLSVRRESQRLIIQRKEEGEQPKAEITVHLAEVDRVTVIGHPAVPISVLQQFMNRGIPVSFVSEKGYWYGTLHSERDNNAARRLLQYRQQDVLENRIKCARKVVNIKILNQRRMLQRAASNRKRIDDKEIVSFLKSQKNFARKASKAESVESLRGIEGASTALYFHILGSFFPEEFPFKKRSRRPPGDAANALLSFCYSIVLSEVETALYLQGLDPCLGWLHETTSGKTTLAFDLIEPLRAPVCDALVLNLLSRSIIKTKNFNINEEDGGTYLTEKGRETFFIHYNKHMERKFKLQKSDTHTCFRQCITYQVWGVLRLLENPDVDNDGLFRMP